MITIGPYRIIHKDDMRKFEKLHKIFREYDEAQLNDIIEGRIHLHRNPVKKGKGNGSAKSTNDN